MKKFFMFAAMASVAFASCVKNDAPELSLGQAEVSFEVPMCAPAVKSVTEVTESTFTSDFKVWGYFTAAQQGTFSSAGLYMNQVNIKLTDGVWKSSEGKYYWPNNGYLTFIGYAPASESTNGTYSVTDAGLNIEGYTVGAAADVDFLVSQVSYNNTKPLSDGNHTYPTYGNGAQIIFEHALSSIQFTMRTPVDANTYLVVKKIEIHKAVNKGNFTQGLSADYTQMTASTYAGGVTNNGWTPSTDAADKVTYVAYEDATGILLTANKVYTNNAVEQTLNKTDLILLPQDLTGLTVEVTFTLQNKTMAEANPVVAPIEQKVTANLKQDGGVERWLRGKRYTYNLTVNLDELTFDPEVSAWVDGAPSEDAINPDYN